MEQCTIYKDEKRKKEKMLLVLAQLSSSRRQCGEVVDEFTYPARATEKF